MLYGKIGFIAFGRKVCIAIVIFALIFSSDFLFFGTNNVHAATQATYYVATNGSDTNPGTLSQPFATITKARDVIRTINGNMTGDIYVYIRGGSYYLNSSITFTDADSGSHNYNIHYQNYPGETVEIVGGQRITNWVQDTGNIYKAYVGTGWNFYTLFENGARAIQARYPNSGYLEHVTASGRWAEATSDPGQPCWFTFKAGDIPDWTDMVGGQVNIWGWFGWHNSTIPITAFDSTNKKITLQRYPFWGIQENPQTTLYYRESNYSRYYIQGVKSALDAAGEFYMNSATGYLYYYPRCSPALDINSQVIVAPRMKNILEFKGYSTNNYVKNITVKGISIRVSDFSNTYDAWYDGNNYANRPNHGADSQDAHYENNEPVTNRYGLIYMNNAANITLDTLDISNSGYNGVFLDGYCQQVVVFNSQIYDIGQSGVFICGGVDNKTDTLISYSNLIQNNHIYNCGRLVGHANGVTIQQSGYNSINHNEIHDIPRSGIMLAGSIDNPSDINLNRCNVINYNKVYSCVTDSSDNGNIYSYSGGKYNVLDHNLSFNCNVVFGTKASYYLDNHSDYWTVSNNIGYSPNYIHQNDNYPTITVANNVLSSNPADWAAAGLNSSQMGRISMSAPVWPLVPTDLIPTNPEFENDLVGWDNYGATAAIDTANAYEGGKCVKVVGNSTTWGAAYRVITGLQPNTTYVLKAYGKKGGGTVEGRLQVWNYGGNEIDAYITGTAYAPYTIQFTTGATNTTAHIGGAIQSTSPSDYCYWDKFELSKANLMPMNPGFEDDFIGWGNYGATATIDTANAYEGGKCVKVVGNSTTWGAAYRVITGLQPNTTYVLKAYGKKGGGTVEGRLQVWNYGGNEIDAYITGTAYAPYTIQFTTGATNTTAHIGGAIQSTSPSDYCYWDRFELKPALISTNPGFESDFTDWGNYGSTATIDTANAYEGSKCVKVVGNSTTWGAAYRIITGLKPNTAYTLKAYGKKGGGTVEGRLQVWNYGGNEIDAYITGTAYAPYTIQFTTGATNTTAHIGGAIQSTSPSDYCYWDKFELMEN